MASLVALSTACGPASSSDKTHSQSRPGSSAAAAPSTGAPNDSEGGSAVGACHNYSHRDVEQVYATERPIDCSESHTAETYRVEVWPESQSPHALSDDARHKVAELICLPLPQAVAGVLTYWSFYVPSPAQWEAGARWLRCDGMVSLNDSETEFARWTGSVVQGEIKEVLPQESAQTPSAPKWRALPSPPSNPTYVVLKRVLLRSDGSHLLTVDPLTPDFDSGPEQGCEAVYVAEPQEGFYCLANVTARDRKVTLLPNADIQFGDSPPQSMNAFLQAISNTPAVIALGLDANGHARSILAIPLSDTSAETDSGAAPSAEPDSAAQQQEVSVLSVIGWRNRDAESALRSQRLRVSVRYSNTDSSLAAQATNECMVIDQQPRGDTQVAEGAVVTILVQCPTTGYSQ